VTYVQWWRKLRLNSFGWKRRVSYQQTKQCEEKRALQNCLLRWWLIIGAWVRALCSLFYSAVAHNRMSDISGYLYKTVHGHTGEGPWCTDINSRAGHPLDWQPLGFYYRIRGCPSCARKQIFRAKLFSRAQERKRIRAKVCVPLSVGCVSYGGKVPLAFLRGSSATQWRRQSEAAAAAAAATTAAAAPAVVRMGSVRTAAAAAADGRAAWKS
jgi:hypothetical protein